MELRFNYSLITYFFSRLNKDLSCFVESALFLFLSKFFKKFLLFVSVKSTSEHLFSGIARDFMFQIFCEYPVRTRTICYIYLYIAFIYIHIGSIQYVAFSRFILFRFSGLSARRINDVTRKIKFLD